MYFVVGVAGGVAFGSNPSSERCEAVKSMSDRLSFPRKRGSNA